jgi:hypothetical protein
VQGSTGNVDRPASGLGAGGGLLVVPAGGALIAYGPGGAAPAPCPNIAVTPPAPALAIDTAEQEIVQGRSATVRGALSGTLVLAGVAVELQRDVWPFDGRWEPVTSTKTGADGSFELRVRTLRNTRYRVAGAGLTSGEKTVYADLAGTLRRSSPRGPTFRSRLTLRAPRGARLPARRAALYVLRSGRRTARLVATPRLRRVRSGVFRASATVRYLRPKRATIVIVCYRERTPDAWGKPLPIDKACGARRLQLET